MRKQIMVGGLPIGGGAPISVQSMTNTKTEDHEATAAQINALAALGCDLVRVAVPTREAADAIAEIKKRVTVPVVADIHFDYKLALRALEAGADKIRINPGNIGAPERVKAVADACRKRNVPIRIGVNGGSLPKPLLEKYGGATAEAMLESALEHVSLLNRYDFDDICISVKSSSVPLTIAAYRLLAQETDYPLHLGVTEAGTEYAGVIRSSVGIGTLLAEGIGDTIRVSLTADPEREAVAGVEILKSLGLRRGGVRFISCPTCGRTQIDLLSLAREVEEKLKTCPREITVAVMGCAVNGPGEASAADYGVAGGKGEGLLFKKGQIVKKVPADQLADELRKLIEEDK
ncbi:MAG: flavodoxin-dependent (E)-4-hydroxy-3-methylbut-2-enyl-diphosphate synthase [Oscillospiraceae bacterium]|nr:flavodoxin-dependent (E)-4-hydroxy-3-methylbut-2-enyl-diphosphate synthase [Oscillospiraceae bacterium]